MDEDFAWLGWVVFLSTLLLVSCCTMFCAELRLWFCETNQTSPLNYPRAPFPGRHTSMQNFATTPIPSARYPDRAVIVQIPEESNNKDNPPDYSNFLPPSYEEAVERDIQSQEELILRYSETIKSIV